MNKSIKLPQITVYKISYGSPLQAYATQQLFKKYGIQCELVNYSPIRVPVEEYKNLLKENKVEFIKRVCHFLCRKLNVKRQIVEKKQSVRANAFKRFCDKNIIFSSEFHTIDELQSYSKLFKVLLSGSDQLWNPVNYETGFFTLEVFSNSLKRISFSSSFGVSTIPDDKLSYLRTFIPKYNFISFREPSGAQIVRDIIGKEYPVTLDPTLVLDVTEWNKLADVSSSIDGEYILAYSVSHYKELRILANNVKKIYKIKIITLPHLTGYNKVDEHFGDISLYDITPPQWLNLIKNAKYVCTDSFHGTIFSILFHKQFAVVLPKFEKEIQSTNVRITDLLERLGLTERAVTIDDNPEIIERYIDWKNMERLLNKERENTYKYLEEIVNFIRKEYE